MLADQLREFLHLTTCSCSSLRKIPKKWNCMQSEKVQILRRKFVSPEFCGSARCG